MQNISRSNPTIIKVDLEQGSCLGFYRYRAGEPPVIGINNWVWEMRHNYNITIRFFQKVHTELLMPGRLVTLPTGFSILAVLTDEGIKTVLETESFTKNEPDNDHNFSYSLN